MKQQEDKQREHQIAHYQSLVSAVEEVLMQLSDADIYNEELRDLIVYFNGFDSRSWPFEACSIIKQQERLDEMAGILESLVDLRDRSIPQQK
jgi:hypothetical protein